MEMMICHKCRMEHPASYTCERAQDRAKREPGLLRQARDKYYKVVGQAATQASTAKSNLDQVADSYHYAEARLQLRQEQLKMMAERALEPPPELMQELEQMKELAEQSRKCQIKAVLADLKLNPRKGYSIHDSYFIDEESYTRGGTVTGRISSAQPRYQELPRAATYPDPSARRDAQHEQALTQPAARFDPFAGYEVKRGAYASEDHMQEPARHPLQRVTEQPGWDGQSKWRPWE